VRVKNLEKFSAYDLGCKKSSEVLTESGRLEVEWNLPKVYRALLKTMRARTLYGDLR